MLFYQERARFKGYGSLAFFGSAKLNDGTMWPIGKPYVLAGHSIAGFYTLDYANRYPGEVSAVVGIDPHCASRQGRHGFLG